MVFIFQIFRIHALKLCRHKFSWRHLSFRRFGRNECRQSERCRPLCLPLGARASDFQSCLSALGACHALGDSQLYRLVSASATRRAVAFQDERSVVLASWSWAATFERLCPACVARFQHLGDHGIQNGFQVSRLNVACTAGNFSRRTSGRSVKWFPC